LIIAVFIFLGAMFIFYKYSINLSNIEQDNVANLIADAKVISSYLVSEGYPPDWTTANVTIIGLMEKDQTLSKDKVIKFSQLAQIDYEQTRSLFSTKHDYFVFLENKNGEKQNIDGIEWIGKNHSTDNPDDIIKIYRFVYYNSTILRLGLYVW